AAARDRQRVFYRLGHIREQLAHLLRGLEVLLLAITARAARIVEHAAIVNAHARLVRLEILLANEAHIVARYHWHAAPRRQFHAGGIACFLVLAPGALQFEVEAIAEPRQPLVEEFVGLRLAPGEQCPADFSVPTDADRDQTIGAAMQPLAA